MLAIAIPDSLNSIQVIEWETTAGAEVLSAKVGHACIEYIQGDPKKNDT